MRTLRAHSLDSEGKPKITEKVFQEQVRKAAIICGWQYFHVWNSMHSAKGFPDVCMTKRGRLIFAELKSDTGHLSDEQVEWLEALRLVPCAEVFVLRPGNFDFFWEVLRR